MQLNHLDLTVPDVRREAAFFERCFGFELLEIRGNDGMAILRGDGGVVLVLTRAPADGPQDAAALYPKSFHVGFLVASEEAVHAARAALEAAGASELGEPSRMRGHLVLYGRSPGGLLIEVGYRPG